MDLGKPFSFMFEDRDWVAKIVIGALFSLLSVVLVGLPFVLGYTLELVRRVAAGREDVLPSWDDLGEKFVQGLILLVILFVYFLPGTLLGGCMGAGVSSLADSVRSNGGATLLGLVSAFISLLAGLYGFVIGLLVPAITIRYAMTRDFGASFNLREIWRLINANLGNYVLVLLISWVAGVISGFGVIACIIGVFLTSFWAMLVSGHLCGQYYREFLDDGLDGPQEPLPPVEPEPTPPSEPATL